MDFYFISIYILSGLALLLIVLELFNLRSYFLFTFLIGLGLLTALALSLWESYTLGESSVPILYNMLLSDSSSRSLVCLILFVSFFWFSLNFFILRDKEAPKDIFILSIMVVVGGILMTVYNHLLIFFLGLELLSFSLYALIGSQGLNLKGAQQKTYNHLNTSEATLKYFLIGSIFTCIFLLGLSFLFVATSHFSLNEISKVMHSTLIESSYTPLSTHSQEIPISKQGLLYTGIFLISFAFLFKIGIVPFHFWGGDVYEGAPTAITTLMVSVVKIAAFSALLRFSSIFSSDDFVFLKWKQILGFLALLTITFSNFTALTQKSPKRLLAFSSLSHAGFLLLAFQQFSTPSLHSYLLYYLSAYSISSILCFSILGFMENSSSHEKVEEVSIQAIQGLFQKNPILCFHFSIALISFMGLPPLAGFFTKYWILKQLFIRHDYFFGSLLLGNALLGFVYYGKLLILSYTDSENHSSRIFCDTYTKFCLFLLSTCLILLGIFPDFINTIITN